MAPYAGYGITMLKLLLNEGLNIADANQATDAAVSEKPERKADQ